MLFEKEITLDDLKAHSSDLRQVIENVRQIYLASPKHHATHNIVCKFWTSVDMETIAELVQHVANDCDVFLERMLAIIRKKSEVRVSWPGVQISLPAVGIPVAVCFALEAQLRAIYAEELAKKKAKETPANTALQSFFKSCPTADVPADGCRWSNNGVEYYVPGSFWDTLYVKDKPVFGFYAIDLERDALVFIEQLKPTGYLPHYLSGREITLLQSYMFELRLTRRL